MQFGWKQAAASAAMLLGASLSTGCASAPERSDEINLSLMPDGSFVALDSKGNPSKDPQAQMMAALLSGLPIEEDEAPVALPEDQIWRQEPGGHLVHLQSGAVCAESVAGIKRTGTHLFSPDGTDVSCQYDGNTSAITLYFYQRESTLEDEIAEAASAMHDRQPVSQVVPFKMTSPAFASYTLAYKRADGLAYRSSALVADVSGWKLKVRLTTPASAAPDMEYRVAVALIGIRDRLATAPAATLPPSNPT